MRSHFRFPTMLLLACAAGCGGPSADRPPGGPPALVATIEPLAMILRELAGEQADVARLLPPGASPHTYEPAPSDIRRVQGAVLFYVSPLLDAWAARLPVEEKIEVIALLPAEMRRTFPPGFHEHSGDGHEQGDHEPGAEIDPHFWLDPLAVAALAGPLAGRLAELDPTGASAYKANAAAFIEKLAAFDAELAQTLAPVRGRALILMHPSINYMLARYGIELAGVVEPAAGREPSPRDMHELTQRVGQRGVRAIFSEPQLPRRPAEALAEATGAKLGEIDPTGGVAGRADYFSLLRFNAAALAEALQ